MRSVESVRDYLEKNPEKKEIVEKQLKYFFPIWIGEKYKEKFVKNLPKEDIEFLFQAQLLTCVSKEEIIKVSNEEEFISIREKLSNVRNGQDSVLNEIYDIYCENFDRQIDEYEKRIDEYKYRNLPAKSKKNVDELLNTGKVDIAKKVINNFYKKPNVKYIKLNDSFNELKKNKTLINIMIFSSNVLQKNPQLLDMVAYVVYKPTDIFNKEVEDVLNDAFSLPGDWYLYRNLSIFEYKSFIKSIRNPDKWNKQYNYTLQKIKEKMNIPILPIIKRKDLLDDVLSLLTKERYDSSIIIMLVIIEGVLWDMSREVHKINKVFASETELYDCKTNKRFESTRIRDIVERTHVSDYLDSEFLKYFCKELYEERNKILHGRMLCCECDNLEISIIKKVFTLDYLLANIIDLYKKNLFYIWDSQFDENKIEEFLNVFYNNFKVE